MSLIRLCDYCSKPFRGEELFCCTRCAMLDRSFGAKSHKARQERAAQPARMCKHCKVKPARPRWATCSEECWRENRNAMARKGAERRQRPPLEGKGRYAPTEEMLAIHRRTCEVGATRAAEELGRKRSSLIGQLWRCGLSTKRQD